MKVALLGVILLVSSSAFAADSFEKELSAEGVDLLTIEWSNGDVELTADDSPSVRISAKGGFAVSDWLDYTEFGVRGSEAVAVFDTKGRAGDISVDLAIRFPHGLGVVVTAGNGDVVVSGGSSLEVEAGNGDLVVSGVTGKTVLAAGNGNVELVLPSGFAAEVALDAGNGEVVLAIGGDFSGDVEVNAGNGDVEVVFAAVPEGLAVDARTGMGSVGTDLPGAEASEGFMGGSISRGGRSCSLEVTAGMGDIVISVE
jgi:DUF4097 and DUF4098 domain-containing protein YvlB